MWHVMIYSHGLGRVYTHPYAVHLLTPVKPSPEEAFRKAGELLDTHFPEWMKGEESFLAYAGYEEIPFDTLLCHYVAVKFIISKDEYKISYYSNVPSELAEKITDYRLREVTFDYDGDDEYTKYVILDTACELENPTIYKTYRGYHLRAGLPSKLDFDEIIRMRRRGFDDFSRIRIDEIYHENGLTFLTNLLFNEKYWIENGGLKHYVEEKIDVKDVVATRSGYVSIKLPELVIQLPKGSISIKGDRVEFKGCFSNKDVQRILRSIEDNLWEYSFQQQRQVDIKERIADAYGKISPILRLAVSTCSLSFEGEKAVLHVPQSLSNIVGRLIGKGGANIRAVEHEVGVRISISQEETPEDVKLKKKLQELLRQVV